MPTFPFLLQAQGAPLPARLPGLVFCQNKGRRTANTKITQHWQCNSAPRLGSTRTWGPSGQRRDRNFPCFSRAESEPPAGHQPPSQPSLLTKQAEPGGHLRSGKHDLQHSETGTHKGCDSSSTSYKPCGARALISGKVSQLGVPPPPAAGSCWQTGSHQVQEGSTCLTQVGQTVLAWGQQGHSTPVGIARVQSCPLPPHQAGNTRPQPPTGEPGPGISLCQGSCNPPCPWEYLLVRSCL